MIDERFGTMMPGTNCYTLTVKQRTYIKRMNKFAGRIVHIER